MLARPYTISFTLAKSDLLQVFGPGTMKLQSRLILLAVVLVVMVFLVETHMLDALFHDNPSEFKLVIYRILLELPFAALLAYSVAPLVMARLLQYYQLWRHPEILGRRTVTVTDEQLLYGSAAGTTTIDWSAFKYRLENDKVFALTYVDSVHGDTGLHIPRRAFADAEQLSDFISLLEKWVPKHEAMLAKPNTHLS
jgi:hypothetical protein